MPFIRDIRSLSVIPGRQVLVLLADLKFLATSVSPFTLVEIGPKAVLTKLERLDGAFVSLPAV